MKINCLKKLLSLAVIFSALVFTSCYSVFSGGTGGTVVDAESTSEPKAGIANVNVYAYVSKKDWNKDFESWTEGSVFTPAAKYYGHTTTGANGGFSISKLVWKAFAPNFGKDADYTEVYLLFYHENYGLTQGGTVILSDSTTDTVYQELTKVRKTTVLNINLIDVATGLNTSEVMNVKVSVPQNSGSKVYDSIITGNGTITVSYPRWKNASDKANGIENKPVVSIEYYQSSDEVSWKPCYNGDSPTNDYDFRTDRVSKTISDNSYVLNLYGKARKIPMPEFEGYWGTANGVELKLLYSSNNGSTYDVDCGSTTTRSIYVGQNGNEKTGYFSDLGTGRFWIDESYTDKYSDANVRITDGSSSKDLTVRSDVRTVNVQK